MSGVTSPRIRTVKVAPKRAEVHRGELQALKRKLNEFLPPKSPQERQEKAKRDRPYVPDKKPKFPDWWEQPTGKHPMLPLKPPTRDSK